MLNDSSALFELSDLDPLANQQALAFLATSTDGVLVVDADWRLLHLSSNSERTLNKTRAELHGKNLWEEFPAAVATRFFSEYQRALKEHVSVTVEDYFALRDRWYEAHACPFQSGLLIYFRDVTERKRAVAAAQSLLVEDGE